MKAILRILFIFLFTVGTAHALDLQALVRQVEQQYWGVSSHSFVTMEVKTAHWQRTLEMESWTLGRDRFLTRILEPAKERGVATLKVGNEVWNYLPNVDRTMKIPPSMMGGSWMGSHITNDDLVKGEQIDKDYSFTLLQETPDFWRIDCHPLPDVPVVWGRIVYQIHRPTRTPEVVEYYDEDNRLVRRIRFDQLTEVEGPTLPLRMTVLPVDKPKESTVMVYHQLHFDVDIGKSFFSLRQLKARR